MNEIPLGVIKHLLNTNDFEINTEYEAITYAIFFDFFFH